MDGQMGMKAPFAFILFYKPGRFINQGCEMLSSTLAIILNLHLQGCTSALGRMVQEMYCAFREAGEETAQVPILISSLSYTDRFLKRHKFSRKGIGCLGIKDKMS